MSENASNSKDSLPRSSSSNSLYKQSAAANMMPSTTAASISSPLPSNNSVQSFRAPFLSPASRPNSTLWSPPSYAQYANTGFPASPSASTTALPLGTSPFASVVTKSKPPLPSTRLAAPLAKSEKPWLTQREPRSRLAYFITYFCIFLGAAAAAVVCWHGIATVDVLDRNSLCLVLDEEFSGSDLDSSTWNKDVELGGFGNGEFEMTTDSSDNLYISNGELFIMPTVTTAKVSNIFQGNYTLQGCTADMTTIAAGSNSTNSTSASTCTVVANTLRGTVIPPVQSARVNTKGKKNIKFGKVEIRAKLPTGDWLWPAVWMLPENNTYGAWPLSGEIDIIEARGNNPTYPAQGSNFVRSTLSYGPLPTLVNRIFGWFSMKRSSFADDFHIYTFEWTENYIRLSVDTVLHSMLTIETKPGQRKNSYWAKAGFPETARNGTDGEGDLVVVQDPYTVPEATRAAPFDQSFYLIIDVAAGGTSGWFPDNKGNKPWFDGSQTAMRDFAQEQDTWYRTWPQSANDRAFRIDYVKMWDQCK
ncbi:glycoside hydrolase family 16 protein [Gymnopilus junonius]|uniref:Glycoside hydrolase family 16 protein n=1 Tax=Gymnopilus junonius TaxID=109634 RepID=A0A9P5TS56_GYMJU|nr:glycoside hydrolase family 16 protein [Gymnopilus junonius]